MGHRALRAPLWAAALPTAGASQYLTSSEHTTSIERYAQLTMTAPLIARVVAAGRIGFGVALVVAPDRVTSLWLGSDAGRPGARVVTRGLGARDVALGVGALAAADSQLQPWVAAAIAADLVATVAAGKSLPLVGSLTE
jgi:hypothetical protein